MSALIRAAEAVDMVRPVPAGPIARPAPRPTTAAATPAEPPAALEAEIETLRDALRQAVDASAEAEKRAREEGREEGRDEMTAAEAKRIEALGEGLAAALARLDARLDALDRLAPLIARTALAKLVDDPGLHTELIGGTLARQLARLRRETVLRVRVSGHDFADDAALEALRARAGIGRTDLVCDPGLAAGECRLDLELGHVDLDLDAQWGELARLLDRLADEGDPR